MRAQPHAKDKHFRRFAYGWFCYYLGITEHEPCLHICEYYKFCIPGGFRL